MGPEDTGEWLAHEGAYCLTTAMTHPLWAVSADGHMTHITASVFSRLCETSADVCCQKGLGLLPGPDSVFLKP